MSSQGYLAASAQTIDALIYASADLHRTLGLWMVVEA